MSAPFSVVCFKWRDRGTGYRLPRVVEYGAKHVNTLRRMVSRNLSMPHDFVCVTDEPEGLDPEIRVVPMWEDWRDLGGCFSRLKVFSPEMRELIGPRFACIDLDCVVTGPLDPLFDRPEDFVINAYRGGPSDPDQFYNGGLFLMTAGARRKVWETFNPWSALLIKHQTARHVCKGSDQAWIRLVLGKSEPRYTDADGVHEALRIRRQLPEGARLVLFAGRRDPTTERYPWIAESYA